MPLPSVIMDIKDLHPYRVEYSGLTETEYNAAVDFCQTNGVAYEDYSGDGRTDIVRTVSATAEETTLLQDLLKGLPS